MRGSCGASGVMVLDAVSPVEGVGDEQLPTASVVIPTRNRRPALERALRALRGEAGVREVIVVDDGSDDETRAWLVAQTEGWPALRPLHTSGVGPDRARGVGVASATGDVVVFLDDDEVAVTGLVAGHCRHHQERERVIVSGYCPTALPQRPSAAMRFLARVYEEAVEVLESDPAHGLSGLWGGNFSVRRSELAGIPLSAPEFERRKGHGDREFGLRCQKAGFSFVLDRDLRADHFFTRTMSEFRADRRKSGYGTVLVHALHGDVVGPLPRDVLESRSVCVTWFLRLTDWQPVYRVATAVLVAQARFGDAARSNILGDIAVRLLARVELRCGAREGLAWAASQQQLT